MAKYLATKPIQNRRMNLKPGDPIPALYSTPEAIKQIKAMHGDDSVRMVEYRRPGEGSAEEGLDPLVLDALEQKVAEQEKHLKSQGEMIGSQHRRIEALEKALAAKERAPSEEKRAAAPAQEQAPTPPKPAEKRVDPSMKGKKRG